MTSTPGASAADPVEVGDLVAHFAGAERIGKHVFLHRHAEHGAVLRRLLVEIIDGAQAPGAGHVLHDHRGVAGNLFADMARYQPGVQVVAAAGIGRHDHRDGLAAIELLARLGARRRDGGREHQCDPCGLPETRGLATNHACPPWRSGRFDAVRAGPHQICRLDVEVIVPSSIAGGNSTSGPALNWGWRVKSRGRHVRRYCADLVPYRLRQ